MLDLLVGLLQANCFCLVEPQLNPSLLILLLLLMLWPCLLLLITSHYIQLRSIKINVNLGLLKATDEFLGWLGGGVMCAVRKYGHNSTIVICVLMSFIL